MSVTSAFFCGILQAVINSGSIKMRCRILMFIIAAKITPFVSMLAGEKKKDWSPILSPIALLHNLIFIDTRNECKSCFFEPFCLPVHSAGSIHLYDPYFRSALNYTRSSFTSTSWAMISQQYRSCHGAEICHRGVSTRSFLND